MEIARGKHPGSFIRRWPVAKLEGELISVTPEQKSIDRRIQAAYAVLFAGTLERREPIDASICSGDIAIERGGDSVNDLCHNDLNRLPDSSSPDWSRTKIVTPFRRRQV